MIFLAVKCSTYDDLLPSSMLESFLPMVDLKELSAAANPQLYKFPLVSSKIESIVMRSPGDIIITDIDSTVDSFHRFKADPTGGVWGVTPPLSLTNLCFFSLRKCSGSRVVSSHQVSKNLTNFSKNSQLFF